MLNEQYLRIKEEVRKLSLMPDGYDKEELQYQHQLNFFSQNFTGIPNNLIPDELPDGYKMRSEGLMNRADRNVHPDISIEDSKKNLENSIKNAFESIKKNQRWLTGKNIE